MFLEAARFILLEKVDGLGVEGKFQTTRESKDIYLKSLGGGASWAGEMKNES